MKPKSQIIRTLLVSMILVWSIPFAAHANCWGYKTLYVGDQCGLQLSDATWSTLTSPSVVVDEYEWDSDDWVCVQVLDYELWGCNIKALRKGSGIRVTFTCKYHVKGYENNTQRMSHYYDITVKEPVDPESINLNYSSVTLNLQDDKTRQLTATVLPSGASQDVNWSVVSGSYVASVSSSGLVTAKSEGTATVRATSSVKSSVWAECEVTVNSNPIYPTSISLPASPFVEIGGAVTLKPTIIPSNATTSLKWKSSDTSVATVSSSGKVKGVKEGTVIITVTTSNNKSDSCIFTVIPMAPPIQFADTKVKDLCVANWDTNRDGELTEAEAAAVKSLGEVFRGNNKITSFNELQYFSGLKNIGNHTFYECKSLTSITIPNSVTSIGDYAFWSCSGLTSITIPNSVTSIGERAFLGCSGLTSVTIPSCVTSIGSGAFQNCSGLTSVTIPNSVTSIGDYAFWSCSGLTSITIPNSVISIGNYTFYNCSGLTSVTIGNGVTSIGCSAFDGCTSLTSITIPNSVTSIGKKAFYNCSSLTSITIPNSVTSIGSYTFNNCSSLTSVTIGNGMTSFGEYTFYKCTSLTSITIPNSVTSIGDYTFYNCSGLTSVTIGNGVTSIGCSAFDGCTSLTSITIPNSVTSIGYEAFSHCSGLTSVTIPNSVTSIGPWAFDGCTGLTSVIIPNSVTQIYCNVFEGCSNLTSVTVKIKSPLKIYANFDISSNAFLYVPKGCKAAYEAATFWNVFKEIVEVDFVVQFADTKVKALCLDYWDTNYDGELSEKEASDVTSLGEVFKGNNEITSFDELQYFTKLTSIGPDAFVDCSNMTSITLPKSVTSIDSNPFQNCSSLTSIKVLGNNTYFDSRNDCNAIIKTSTNTLVAGCQNSVIPKSVKSIRERAFYGCSGLTSVSIPDSVTSIGNYAFYGCNSLTFVKVKNASPAEIGDNTFSNSSNATLYVPAGSKSAYEAADYWKDFKKIVEFPNLDVNQDDEVDVLDVVDIARFVVGTPSQSFDEIIADINNDKVVNLGDAVALVNEIAGEQNFVKAFVLESVDTNDALSLVRKNDVLSLNLENERYYTAFQFDLYVPEDADVIQVSLTVERKQQHQLLYNKVEDGHYRVAALSTSNNEFNGNDGELLNIALTGADNSEVSIRNIKFFDAKGQEYRFDDIEGAVATSLKTLSDSPLKGENIYNLAGQRLNKMQRGVNIVGGKKIIRK